MKPKRVIGVSLVEVMVTMAVLGVILALAAPSFADMLNRRRVQAVAEQISTDLAFARAESGLRPRGVTVYFRQNCYSMAYFSTGANCVCTRDGNACNNVTTELKTARVPANIGVSFAPSTASGLVGFQSPQMTPSPADFSVLVSGVRGAQLRVELNSTGRVRTCSPNSSFSGVAACE